MTSAAASWTSERIAALAVDLKALERARKLSKPSKGWSGLAADDEGSVLRGTCSGSSGRYEVSVDLRVVSSAQAQAAPSNGNAPRRGLGGVALPAEIAGLRRPRVGEPTSTPAVAMTNAGAAQ